MDSRAIDNSLVQHVVEKIVKNFHPKRILVFGSYARGEIGPDSDLDILVEMESDKPPLERAVEVDSIFGLRNWPMDLLVYTPREFEQAENEFGSFISMIKDEAKVVYEHS